MVNNCHPIDGVIVIENSNTSPVSASVADAWNIDFDVAVFSSTDTVAPLTLVKTGLLLISDQMTTKILSLREILTLSGQTNTSKSFYLPLKKEFVLMGSIFAEKPWSPMRTEHIFVIWSCIVKGEVLRETQLVLFSLTVIFLLIVSCRFLCCSSSLCVGGFVCGVCFVIVALSGILQYK